VQLVLKWFSCNNALFCSLATSQDFSTGYHASIGDFSAGQQSSVAAFNAGQHASIRDFNAGHYTSVRDFNAEQKSGPGNYVYFSLNNEKLQ